MKRFFGKKTGKLCPSPVLMRQKEWKNHTMVKSLIRILICALTIGVLLSARCPEAYAVPRVATGTAVGTIKDNNGKTMMSPIFVMISNPYTGGIISDNYNIVIHVKPGSDPLEWVQLQLYKDGTLIEDTHDEFSWKNGDLYKLSGFLEDAGPGEYTLKVRECWKKSNSSSYYYSGEWYSCTFSLVSSSSFRTTMNKEEITLRKGETDELNVSYSPSGSAYFSWKSSDPSVAEVIETDTESKVRIKALSPGTTTITAQRVFEASLVGPVASCKVTVLDDNTVCGDNLTWSWSEDGQLVISGEGEMYDYEPAYQDGTYLSTAPWGDQVTDVVIQDGVTSIGEGAFYKCDNLNNLQIADSVTSIGYVAFFRCASLNAVTFPAELTRIGPYAFGGCTGIEELVFPEKLITIEEGAFTYCTGLEYAFATKALSTIGEDVFSNCPNLLLFVEDGSYAKTYASQNGLTHIAYALDYEGVDFILPSNLVKIESEAFAGISAQAVQIPETVSEIGARAFASCGQLKRIYILPTVTVIDETALDGVTDVKVYGSGTEAMAFAEANGFEFVLFLNYVE